MKKNIYKLLLSAVALLAFTVAAQAQTDIPDSQLTWTLTDNALTIAGKGAMPNYTTSTGAPWNKHTDDITTITVEEGVTSIGDNAFVYCVAVPSVILPQSVTSIGNSAFDYCQKLTSITLPDELISIGKMAFFYTKLESIIIPEMVTSIGNNAFAKCTSLTKVTLLNPVPVEINSNVFDNVNIANATLNVPMGTKAAYEAAPVWKDFGKIDDGTSFSWEYADGVLTISGVGPMPDYAYNTIPWSNHASEMTKVVIEEGITTIGTYAFYGCKMTSIALPESLTNIGEAAFLSANQLTSVKIGDNVSSISKNAFNQCTRLVTFELGSSVASIGEGAFYFCKALTSVIVSTSEPLTLDPNVSIFGDVALEKVTLVVPAGSIAAYKAAAVWQNFGRFADGITGNLYWSYADGTLTIWGEGEMPDYNGDLVQLLPWYTWRSEITTLTIEEGVTSIGFQAFYKHAALNTVSLPLTLNAINKYAFMSCTALETITIPALVTAIDQSVFYGCTALREVTALNPIPVEITADVFTNVNLPNATLYVPKGTKAAYKAADVWKEFGTINDGETSIDTPEFPIQNIHTDGNRVVITGVENPSVSLYSVTGQLLGECRTNEITVPGTGVYLLKINNQIARIMCKD